MMATIEIEDILMRLVNCVVLSQKIQDGINNGKN